VVGLVVLVVVVAAGAGGYALAGGRLFGGQTTATPSASASPAPSESPSASSNPSTAPATPVPVPLTCRIAVAGFEPGSGGFVSFPGGEYQVDPGSNVKFFEGYGPYGASVPGLNYVTIKSKWVPVPYEWVAPDGSSYAYAEPPTSGHDIYIAPVAGGNPREVLLDRHYEVRDWEPEGIYVSRIDTDGPQANISRGLTRVDPGTGRGTFLTDQGNWTVFSRSAAFGVRVPANEDSPPPPPTKLQHIDLADGRVTDWFDAKGLFVTPLAVDSSGAALVQARNDVSIEVWRVTGPGAAERLSVSGAGQDALSLRASGITDGDRVWLGSNKGLVLYTQVDGFKIVSQATASPASKCH
jgi:hypothetical protein